MPMMQNPVWVTQQQTPIGPAPQVVAITVFPDPVPSGATATIHINAQSAGVMAFTLAASTGPAPQPTADPSVWTWTAP